MGRDHGGAQGSYIKPYPLFRYNLDDYVDLFAEKLDFLLKLREAERIICRGKPRSSLDLAGIYPRPLHYRLPAWIAVGGTRQSVVRAATLGLSVALAIIGGDSRRFVLFLDLYGHSPRQGAAGARLAREGRVADSQVQLGSRVAPQLPRRMSRSSPASITKLAERVSPPTLALAV